MNHVDLRKPVSSLEVANLLNVEGMPKAGKDIIRRMAFELELLRKHQELKP